MNIDQVVFFTGCDARYFSLCIDLINSIKAVNGALPRMRVLDLGLETQQLSKLKGYVEGVIEPMWELGQQPNYPSWFRGMTSRPFLPKYASDAEIVVWIDADTWVQRWQPLENLINAARDGALAIVEEQFGQGFTMRSQSPNRINVHQYGAASLKENLRRCYEQCFGDLILVPMAIYRHSIPACLPSVRIRQHGSSGATCSPVDYVAVITCSSNNRPSLLRCANAVCQ